MRAIDDADANVMAIDSVFGERRGIGKRSVWVVTGNMTVGQGQTLPMREVIFRACRCITGEWRQTPALAGVSGQKWLNARACQ